MREKSVHVAHREPHMQGGDVSLVEEEVFDTVRKEKAGCSVQTIPSQTSANTEPTQLRQRARTWAEETGHNC